MKTIDKLLLKACTKEERITLVMLKERDDIQQYSADIHYWDGIPGGKARSEHICFSTKQEMHARVENALRDYKDVPVIIDDIIPFAHNESELVE